MYLPRANELHEAQNKARQARERRAPRRINPSGMIRAGAGLTFDTRA